MIKIGFTLINHFTLGADTGRELPRMPEQLRAARDSGLRSLWLGQHFLMGNIPYFAYTPLMARLIPEAGDMTVGPCIQLLPLYNPVAIAEEAATLDVLFGGRYVLGVGLGYRPEECDAFGIGWKERAGRLSEGADGSLEDFARDRFLVGDKGAVKDEILRYNEALGVNHFIMRLQWPGHDHEMTMKRLRRLGETAAAVG